MVNWKGALVLLLAAAGLGVYLFQTRPPATPATAPGRVFLACTAADTIELRVEGSSGAVVLLTRPTNRDGWALVSPTAGKAEDARVDALLTDLHTLRPTDTLATPAAGTDYGFGTPFVAVACRVSSGLSSTLTIGKQSFDGSSRYARLGDDPKVYVLSGAEVDRVQQVLVQPPYRPSPIPSGPSPSPTT